MRTHVTVEEHHSFILEIVVISIRFVTFFLLIKLCQETVMHANIFFQWSIP